MIGCATCQDSNDSPSTELKMKGITALIYALDQPDMSMTEIAQFAQIMMQLHDKQILTTRELFKAFELVNKQIPICSTPIAPNSCTTTGPTQGATGVWQDER